MRPSKVTVWAVPGSSTPTSVPLCFAILAMYRGMMDSVREGVDKDESLSLLDRYPNKTPHLHTGLEVIFEPIFPPLHGHFPFQLSLDHHHGTIDGVCKDESMDHKHDHARVSYLLVTPWIIRSAKSSARYLTGIFIHLALALVAPS
jgi:hypothetical protein